MRRAKFDRDFATMSLEPVDEQPIVSAFPEPLTIRIATAVELTGISRSKLYELIKAKELETVKIGASSFIIFASLRQLIESRRR